METNAQATTQHQETKGQAGPFYTFFVDDREFHVEESTITGGQIMDLAGIAREVGLLLIFVVTPMAVGVALLAATATAGFAVLLLPLYWIGVMFHVYGIEDRVGPPTTDEGEQY